MRAFSREWSETASEIVGSRSGNTDAEIPPHRSLTLALVGMTWGQACLRGARHNQPDSVLLAGLDEIGRRLALGNFKELNLIIKGDVDGSVEALADSLLKLSTNEIAVKVVHKGVGQISESDVNLAVATDAIIIGFNVRPSQNARKIADGENIEIKLYSIIYKAIEDVKSAMEGLMEPTIEEKIIGNLDVREAFNITKVGTIAGCFVREGRIMRSSKVRVIRDGIVIHNGVLSSLKRFKDDVKEVVSGMDCGVQVKDFQDIKGGDTIEVFEETEIQRKL